ncbi:hypothetical protein PIB30_037374, partial [Stylosanthes scabra]|nr:hypothetical protein [Stylosanthes scabra]
MLCSYETFALTPPSYPRSSSARDLRPTRSTYRGASALSPSRMWHITWVCARTGHRWGMPARFGRHYEMEPWDMVEQYLGARPPPVHDDRRVVFAIRLTWLRERLQQMPGVADEVTWRQYAR